MEDWKKISISIGAILVLSTIFDYIVSYIAYLRNPLYFITFEANREAVSFFVYNKIPVGSIVFHVFVLVAFTYYCYRLRDYISSDTLSSINKGMLLILVVLMLLLSLGHIFGGLTWFDTEPYISFVVLELIRAVVVSLATLSVATVIVLYLRRMGKWIVRD